MRILDLSPKEQRLMSRCWESGRGQVASHVGTKNYVFFAMAVEWPTVCGLWDSMGGSNTSCVPVFSSEKPPFVTPAPRILPTFIHAYKMCQVGQVEGQFPNPSISRQNSLPSLGMTSLLDSCPRNRWVLSSQSDRLYFLGALWNWTQVHFRHIFLLISLWTLSFMPVFQQFTWTLY